MSSDENDLPKDLKITPKTEINILLLGETGVGKSTFINSIANYLTYTNFKRAMKENLLTLIPSTCKVKDKEGIVHIVKIGSADDKNEFLAVGESATQDVKSYVFPILDGNTKVRLIDTPGIGDTRGIEQDNINYENILSYIGQLHELHAICILFKPTNSRLTTSFHYCMFQILTRLDKSASNNIIILFTNTRGTDYGPGETLPLLQKVIEGIKTNPPHADIPLDKNIFCFDNEAYRYLAAVKQGVDFDARVRDRNEESWEKSVEQCWSLVRYIVGDADNRPLTPHFLKNTNAINEARRLIVQLSKPLVEITQLIHDNLRALERHKEHLNLDTNTLETLKKKLYMPVINLDVKELPEPVTVCTHLECAEMYKVGDLEKWHYKKRCHDPCYLQNVPKEIIGSPELVNCYAMDGTSCCRFCSHMFSVHMHIYYMTETKEDKIIDPNVQSNIGNKEKVVQNVKKLIEDISTRKSELENEHDMVITCSARFAHFLRNNAITPFSDSYKEYIEHLIIQEKSHPVSDKELLRHLQNLLKEYEEAKKIFDQALTAPGKKGTTASPINAQDIQDSIQDLYKLKHTGKKMRELYECQKQSRNKEHEHSTEYIHKVVSKQPEVKIGDKTKRKTKKQRQKKTPDNSAPSKKAPVGEKTEKPASYYQGIKSFISSFNPFARGNNNSKKTAEEDKGRQSSKANADSDDFDDSDTPVASSKK